MSWSNPQIVGKVAGEEIVAELGDGSATTCSSPSY
jgi:hypothetical protein